MYLSPGFTSSQFPLTASKPFFVQGKTKKRKALLDKSPLRSNHQSLNTILQSPNLSHQIARLVRRDARRNHRATDATGASEGDFARHVDVRHVFVFGQEGKMQEDGEGGCIYFWFGF